jgi:hypothetical protein
MPKNALYFVSIAFIFYVAVGLDDCLICFYVATLFFTIIFLPDFLPDFLPNFLIEQIYTKPTFY